MSITLASDVIIIPYFLDMWRTIFIIFSQRGWENGESVVRLDTEAWPSGWRRTTRNRVGSQESRRFESFRFRQDIIILSRKRLFVLSKFSLHYRFVPLVRIFSLPSRSLEIWPVGSFLWTSSTEEGRGLNLRFERRNKVTTSSSSRFCHVFNNRSLSYL